MKRYSTKHFKRILIANNVNIDIDLKTGIVAKNMAKKEKIKLVPFFGLKRFYYPQKVLYNSKPSNSKPVNEKPIQEPSQEGELFGGSVTMGAAPSPRHLPIPTFCMSSKLIKT
ncbi:Strong similarity to a hypothetical protein F18L15.110 gi/6522618 from Arabidopsis thaliana BAC F18L15 gb/AL133298 [Arabidopsis thaliana]|uniref:F5D14.9 protein n=1 Tax=Arabidopsis thaliana TaxID=3702 RepID=Q9LQM6_ARATH|nr:Strong similarity to a hypothetical protein F18L15.110 gi/6522618 from Arabidopsis thaliana BAC F18L15 gb/AL133298 [Arabidopsis thaliana]